MSKTRTKVKGAWTGLSKTEKNIIIGAVVLGALTGLILLARKPTTSMQVGCIDGSCRL